MKSKACMGHLSFLPTALICLVLVTGCSKRGDQSSDAGAGGGKTAAKKPTASEAKIEAIRQAGEPTTPEEVNAMYAEPPAGQNAAPLYAAAFAALTGDDAKAPRFLSANTNAVRLLQEAALRKQCRYPVDLSKGYDALLPHLAKIKASAQLLEMDVTNKAAKGRSDQCVASISAGLALARSLEEEPMILSHHVRIVAGVNTVAGLEESLTRMSFSESQLASLQSAIAGVEAKNVPSLVRALTGERAMCLSAWASPELLVKLVKQAEDAWLSDSNNPTAETPGKLAKLPNSAAMEADKNYYLEKVASLIEATKTPFPKSLDMAEAWKTHLDKSISKEHIGSALFLPALTKLIERSARFETAMRVTQAALAVERFRIAHKGVLPTSLDELAPQYLNAVPADPFDGAPLRYKKLSPRGFTVYSVGPDRQDNGGIDKPAGAASTTKYDLTFTVAR